jgi:iron complex outermembrane receptor protein
VLAAGCAALALSLSVSARAGPIVGAGETVREFETPGGVGGDVDSFDAAAAQGERLEAGERAAGVSRRTGQKVEEILVTARKRTEFLEDTPIAVTALSEESLQRSGVTRLSDISGLVPNLQFQTGRTGQSATVFIRGVGQANSPVLTFDPGVGIYVDGVYLARGQGSIIDIVDVEQIEVLRGPQGTLFGKNTVGGAINVTTVKPGPELEAFAMVRVGNYDTIDTRASLNIPIDFGYFENKLFTRLAVATQNSQGYTYNTWQNDWWSGENSVAFLGSLRFLPTDGVTIDLSGTWSRNHTRTKGGECVFIQDTDVIDAFWPPKDEYRRQCEESEPFRFGSNVASMNDVESYGAWATATWDIPELGSLTDLQVKLISSWREQIPRLREDYDMTPQAVAQASQVGGDGNFAGEPGFARQISEELQIAGAALDEKLTFVAGYYVFWEIADEEQSVVAFPGPLMPGPSPIGDLVTATVNRTTEVDNWSWALFTQASYDLAEWASVTAGVRYNEEKKGLFLSSVRPPLPPDNPVQPALPIVSVSESAIFTAWTPMASIALRLPDGLLEGTDLDHLMSYFTFSRGFKSGGFNGMVRESNTTELSAYLPEFLDSFEIGVKSVWLDQRLTANVAVFVGKYTDQQVQSVVSGPPLVAGGPPEISLEVNNAASSTSRGMEFEMAAMPLEGLRIDGNFALLDARYDSFIAPSAIDGTEYVNRAGQRFLFSPAFQSYLGAQYSFAIPQIGPSWLEGWITPRLEWVYQGSIFFAGQEMSEGKSPAVNLLNGRLSYDFLDDQAQIAFWSKNMLNTTYFRQITGSAQSFGTIARFYEPPRTWGVEFSFRF